MGEETAPYERGTLYVVSTPIGNLEDITLRALKILQAADLIAAESAEHTRMLCRHFDIRTRVVRYNQHNEKAKTPELLKRLLSGRDLALVTNAGTPGVSDPGLLLVRRSLDEGIRVSPVPGPSAVTAALSVSGLRGDRFLFLGFLSHRPGRRKRELRSLATETRTMVFFETPHRIEAMLKDLSDILGDRKMVLVREITKLHEEVIRGSVKDILTGLGEKEARGEFTLVVEGLKKDEEVAPQEDRHVSQGLIRDLLGSGMGVREVAERVSREEGLPYREVYRSCLSMKRQSSPPARQ